MTCRSRHLTFGVTWSKQTLLNTKTKYIMMDRCSENDDYFSKPRTWSLLACIMSVRVFPEALAGQPLRSGPYRAKTTMTDVPRNTYARRSSKEKRTVTSPRLIYLSEFYFSKCPATRTQDTIK